METTGTVDFINYADDNSFLILGFDELTNSVHEYHGCEVIADNLAIAKSNGIEEKIKIGSTVTFITAPRHLYDGYVLPMVAITVDGEELLGFEEGFENFVKYVKSR